MLYFETMPEAVLIGALISGAAMILWSLRVSHRAYRLDEGVVWEVRRLILLAKSLRLLLSGLCIVGWAMGWMYDVRWLIVASIVIGLEELYECSMALAFLEKIEDNERGFASGATVSEGHVTPRVLRATAS